MIGFALLASLPAVVVRAEPEESSPRTYIEWLFDTDGDFQGWVAAGHIADARVSGGELVGQSIDWDPILLGPVFEIPAEATQRLEIKMKTTKAGPVQIFWTQTLERKYGRFGQTKIGRFDARAGDEFQVYRVDPFWHAAGKIVRLRIDPPSDATFAIESIRIVGEGALAASGAKEWKFDADAGGWLAWRDVAGPVVRDGCLEVTGEGKPPVIMSPPLGVAAAEHPYVAVRMAVESGSAGRVFCVSSTQFGLGEVTFPLRADGKKHTYNVDVGNLGHWRDQILRLGLQPTDAEAAVARIESIEIADAPRGPAELEIGYFGPAEAVNRAGRPAEVTLSVKNLGGDVAENVVATLDVGEGVRVIGQPRQTIDRVTPWLAKTASWRIEASRPGSATVRVTLETLGAESVRGRATMRLTPAPRVPQASYVPEPKPIQSEFDVGAFYFPGWATMTRWLPIFDFPERKPVLGWYDESNPECADWQIKWAVEHGITFFMVDWYWSKGNRHLEHWLHDAYMKARHRKHLKWCIMWANHNAPNTHSADDWRAVTQYWIDHYLGMDEYYRIDGRPAVFIWAPGNIRRDLGSAEEAAKLYAMSQKMARDAGLPGIYFVAMSSNDSETRCKELGSEGYEAFTTYHGFQLAASRAGARRFPFADVVETSPEVWEEADGRASELQYIPIADTGWASQPWHKNKALVIHDRTPELFGQLCRKMRTFAERKGKKIVALGPINEWGEGSYIEPYAEYGFQDLDQLRAAFCPPGDYPPNLIPADVGLGPYDLPPMTAKTAWKFDSDADREGWTPNGHVKVEVKGGLLTGTTTGNDPVLQGPGVQIEAASTGTLILRMRSTAADSGRVFWATSTSSQSEANSLGFDVFGDNQFHDYHLDFTQSPRWRGLITSVRLDPATRPGVEFAVEQIRFR